MDASGSATATFWSGDTPLCVDFAARSVFVDGVEVHLTPTEFDIVDCLARRAGTVVSTSDLIDAIWGEWFGPVDHIFVHVHHIRRKLDTCGRLIVTKRKAGYLLRDQPSADRAAGSWPQLTHEYSGLLQEDARSRESIWLLVDKDQIVTWVSDSIKPHLGWSPVDLLGKHPWVIAAAEDAEKLERAFRVKGVSPFVSLPTRVRHSDGHLVDLRQVANVIIGADGRRLGGVGEWIVLSSDAQESVEEERTAMPFLLHYDGDHVLRAVEPHQPFLGWDPDEAIGRPFSMTGLDLTTRATLLEGLVKLGAEHSLGVTPVSRADGTAGVVDMRLRLAVGDGVLVGYSVEVRVLE